MSVKVTLFSRLGNNLFQYAMGRIIAEHHGLELECEHIRQQTYLQSGRHICPSDTLEDLSEYFPNAPLYIPGKHVMQPVEYHHATQENPSGVYEIDLEQVLADETPRKIRLNGLFYRFEYFANYTDQIKDWFTFIPVKTRYVPKPEDVLVNIRRGVDFEAFDWTLPLPYYTYVLSNLDDIGQVYVCGTGIDEQVHRCLAEYDPIYFDGTTMEDFTFITLFDRIILANSTFSWWAGFLSEASELYAPRAVHPKAFGFTGYKEVDLHMREERYHEIDVNAMHI